MDYRGTNGNDFINQAILAIPDWTNIYGDAGDDFITIGNANAIGGAGNDTITGTTSASSVAYWFSPARVVVNLQTGKTQDGYGTVDTLKNIRVVKSSIFDDELTGSTADENFWLGGGNKAVVGGGGYYDTVTYYGQKSTNTTITYNAAKDTFTVVKNFTDGDRGTDILTGVSSIFFLGPGSDNLSVSRKAFVAEGGFFRATDVNSMVRPSDAFEPQFRAGDFNGDGHADYLIQTQLGVGTAPAPMYIFLGDGTGRFVDGTLAVFSSIPMNIGGGGRTLVADFNRDGISDVLQLNFGLDAPPYPGGLNSMYLSSSVTQKLADVSATLVQKTARNHSLSAGDVNGDGFLDVLVNTLDLGNELYLNDGAGHFVLRQDLIPQPMSGGRYLTNTSSGIVDINGDGAPDLIIGRWDGESSPATSQILLNDGTGRFTKIAPIPLPASTVPLEIILDVKGIDLNGDGLTDLMLSITTGSPTNSGAYYETAYIQLLVSQGNGKFTDETATRLPASVQDAFAKGWFTALAAVDINRDGHPDIVATGLGGGASVVLINRGDGAFYQSWSSEVGGSTIAADVNGDGMLDLLTNIGSNTYVDINKLSNGHIYKTAIDGNRLTGSDGNDTMFGAIGNDSLDGGAGIDTAVFSVERANYTITHTGASIAVKANSGSEGTDTLTNIERLKFADTSVALDVSGNAGRAYRIYKAALDRVPDLKGLGDWIYALDTSINTLKQVAQGFIASPEFQAKYGANSSNETFITLLYSNVLHRSPDPGGYADWQRALDQGYSRSDLLIGFSESPENQANVASLIANGIEYQDYFLG